MLQTFRSFVEETTQLQHMINQQLLTRCVFDVIILLLAILLVTFIILFVYTDLFEVHKHKHMFIISFLI